VQFELISVHEVAMSQMRLSIAQIHRRNQSFPCCRSPWDLHQNLGFHGFQGTFSISI
jgi:hypothetical protein